MATPYVLISYSDDGGETFGHEMKKPLIGDDKNYLTRIRLFRQGSAFGRIYRLKCSDNISFTLISAHADIEAGI